MRFETFQEFSIGMLTLILITMRAPYLRTPIFWIIALSVTCPLLFNSQISKPASSKSFAELNDTGSTVGSFETIQDGSEGIDATNGKGVESITESNVTVLRSNDHSSPSHFSYQYPDVIYGHVHMAKTGGTYLNGFLANNFERVCGHKGYSYDAYQSNVRFEKKPYNINSGYGRDRVPFDTMQEIGFEDCDFISNERTWNKFWLQFNNFHDTPMELHLPCRDPIDHLMSQCNFRKKSFNCQEISIDDETLARSIQSCLIHMSRFDYKLNDLENILLKCYDFQYQFTTYLDYVSANLQPRRFVSDYKQRETNRPRVKQNECIWQDEKLMERVENYLVNNIDYYEFCHHCLGGENDLTRKVV